MTHSQNDDLSPEAWLKRSEDLLKKSKELHKAESNHEAKAISCGVSSLSQLKIETTQHKVFAITGDKPVDAPEEGKDEATENIVPFSARKGDSV